MKTVNVKNGLVNNQSQIVETVGNSNEVMNPLFRLVEKRYGIKIEPFFCICEDRTKSGIIDNELFVPDSILFMNSSMCPEECAKTIVGRFDPTIHKINTVNSIYELTKTGRNSAKHPKNDGLSSENGSKLESGFRLLIPILFMSVKKRTYGLRLDNHIIRELLFDTEKILNGDKDRPELSSEDLEKEMKDKLKDQKEMIKYMFGPRTWR